MSIFADHAHTIRELCPTPMIRPANPPGVPSWPSLLTLLVLILPCALEGQETAIVSQVRGNARVLRGPDSVEVPVKMGLRLLQEDWLEIARGSRVGLLFSNGRLVAATTSMKVTPLGGPGAKEIFDRASRTLAAAQASERPSGGEGVKRPPPTGAYPLSPGLGASVLLQRPTFAWQAEEDAEFYVLQIRPGGGGPPRRFTVQGPGPWTLPDSVAPLNRGAEYLWTVVPLPGGRMGGEERFTVLGQEPLEALETFLASLREAGLDPDSDGLFLVATFYADLGLLNEAEEILHRLTADTSPSDRDPVVDLLHADVLARLGRGEEAQAAFDRARQRGG